MNAAIRAVVRTAHFHGLAVSGIYGGFDGLIKDEVQNMEVRDVSNIIQRGGTILRSARSAAFRTVEGRSLAKATLDRHGIDGLVAIGGDGTFRGAAQFSSEHGVPVVGITGTIDNDLAGTDTTIGFDTATNTAMEAVDRIRDTASSHDRMFFVEVMGRTCGAIALHCGLAAGAERLDGAAPSGARAEQGIDELIAALEHAETSKSSVIVIVAEGDEQGGAYEVARKVKERYDHYDTRVSVLGHVQRGGNPSVADRVLASRSGVAAVEALMAGHTDTMVGERRGKIALIPFMEVLGKRQLLEEDLLRILHILSI